LRDGAAAGAAPALAAGGDSAVGGTGVADAVAALRHVADAGRGPADRHSLGVVRACRARPAAGLRDVAHAGGRATDGAAGDEAVGGTVVADAVAALRHVADAGRGPADRRALRVRGTARARPGTLLRDVADAASRSTRGA